MTPLLHMRGVCKRYGAMVVTDAVDFTVAPGEAVGIIGPNGAGKSTLFNLITGDARCDAGTIMFDGRAIGALPSHKRARAGIGRSFQIPQPFGRMSVYENLLVGAHFACGRGNARARCGDVLDMTGLSAKADVPAGTLTLLERKRLELARALSASPKLLLLDEIAGGLAEGESASLVETIRAVHRTGTTIVWIEHVLPALLPVVSRLVVLNFGRVLMDGPPEAIVADAEVRAIYLGADVA